MPIFYAACSGSPPVPDPFKNSNASKFYVKAKPKPKSKGNQRVTSVNVCTNKTNQKRKSNSSSW